MYTTTTGFGKRHERSIAGIKRGRKLKNRTILHELCSLRNKGGLRAVVVRDTRQNIIIKIIILF